MKEFLQSNSWQMRLARTILQGVVGVLIANVDLFMGYTAIPPELRPVIAGLAMAVLSPIMAALGGDADDHAGNY